MKRIENEIKKEIKRIKRANRETYKALKLACTFNGGHIASFKEIMQAGSKGQVSPFIAVQLAIYLLIVLITMGLL